MVVIAYPKTITENTGYAIEGFYVLCMPIAKLPKCSPSSPKLVRIYPITYPRWHMAFTSIT